MAQKTKLKRKINQKPQGSPNVVGRKDVSEKAFNKATLKKKRAGSLEKAAAIEKESAAARKPKLGPKEKPLAPVGERMREKGSLSKSFIPQQEEEQKKELKLTSGKLLGQDFQLPVGEEGQGLPPELALASAPGAFGGGIGTLAGLAGNKKRITGIDQTASDIAKRFKQSPEKVKEIINDRNFKKAISDATSTKKALLGINPTKTALGVGVSGLFLYKSYIEVSTLVNWMLIDNVIGQSERRVGEQLDDVYFRGKDPAIALQNAIDQRESVVLARDTAIEISSKNPFWYRYAKVTIQGIENNFEAMDQDILALRQLQQPTQNEQTNQR